MSYRLVRLPRVLLLHVKRFEVHFANQVTGALETTPTATAHRPVMIKRHDPVAGPLTLDVSEFVADAAVSTFLLYSGK
jgi:hypothetical protein